MSTCNLCGGGFSCAMEDHGEMAITPAPCWCTSLAALSTQQLAAVAVNAGGLCLCPACLVAVIDSSAQTPAFAAPRSTVPEDGAGSPDRLIG